MDISDQDLEVRLFVCAVANTPLIKIDGEIKISPMWMVMRTCATITPPGDEYMGIQLSPRFEATLIGNGENHFNDMKSCMRTLGLKSTSPMWPPIEEEKGYIRRICVAIEAESARQMRVAAEDGFFIFLDEQNLKDTHREPTTKTSRRNFPGTIIVPRVEINESEIRIPLIGDADDIEFAINCLRVVTEKDLTERIELEEASNRRFLS